VASTRGKGLLTVVDAEGLPGPQGDALEVLRKGRAPQLRDKLRELQEKEHTGKQ